MEKTGQGSPTTGTPPGGSSPAGMAFPWMGLFILVIGPFMAILDGSIINVAMPRMMSIFGVGPDRIQWVMTAYLLASGVVIPLTGYLGDRLGNKRMYMYSLAAFTIGSVLCGLAWSSDSLVVFRVIQAIGGGAMIPISMGMLFQIVPRDRVGMAMGMWGIAAMMAPAIGPTFGGWLVDAYSWRTIFFINIPVGIFAIMLTSMALKETPVRPNLKFDGVGFALCAIGCFAVLLALSEGQARGWTSYFIVNLFVIAFFSLTLFTIWEMSTPQPMLDVRMLANPVFSASLAATALVNIGLFAGLFLIPIFAQTLMGLTPMQTGLMLMPMALISGLMMPISGKLYDKIGAVPLGVVGLIIMAVTTYQLHTITTETTFRWLQVMLSLRAVGMGLTMMPLTTAGLNTIPPALTGRASSFNNLVRQIAASFGIAYLTYVMTKRQALHSAWLSEGVSVSSPVTSTQLQQMQQGLQASGVGPDQALSLLAMEVQRQSMALAIGDTFIVGTVLVTLAIPLVFLLGKRRVEEQRRIEEEKYKNVLQG